MLFSVTEQDTLFREFTEVCRPSQLMNKATFHDYMLAKGAKENELNDLFRYNLNNRGRLIC